MGWFKVDDQLAFHAKVMLAGNSAMGLWIRAGAWSSAHLTDGFVPTHMASAMANMANGMAKPCDQDALVMAGLWDEVEGGYQFHDWSDFQPSADEERERREKIKEARKQAGKKGAAARWNASDTDGKNGKTIAKPSQTDSNPDGKPMAPTRPDHKRTSSSPAAPPMEFDQFWAAYPRRVGKQAAIKAWAKAVKITEPQKIIDAAASYARTVRDKDPQYTAHPSSWLNAGRWDDEPLFSTPAFDPWASEGVHA
ncbi:hypothetical protein AB0284_21445 [Pseudarthrobacter phenanthrenivorans]|uniref:hypothetical protein n=1 Tax=Pseudarthrobacter phenanthrenivorans TaxID=361575 RepID=UPI00344F8DDE